jgi:hypothetical protein
VRVQPELLTPSVQHGEEADFRAKVSMANCYFAKPHGMQHCYIPFLYVIDLKRALNFGEAQRYDELDEGRLKSLVQTLHGHAGQYREARECVRYLWNNRHRMRYPKFHKQRLLHLDRRGGGRL